MGVATINYLITGCGDEGDTSANLMIASGGQAGPTGGQPSTGGNVLLGGSGNAESGGRGQPQAGASGNGAGAADAIGGAAGAPDKAGGAGGQAGG